MSHEHIQRDDDRRKGGEARPAVWNEFKGLYVKSLGDQGAADVAKRQHSPMMQQRRSHVWRGIRAWATLSAALKLRNPGILAGIRGYFSKPSLKRNGSMSKQNSTLTQERLREVLKYCPATGLFSWNMTIASRAKAGEIAGTNNGAGYTKIRISGVQYYAHRLAFLYIYGWMPENVDHKNGDRSNNSLCNIRRATESENSRNMRRPHRDNGTGLLGASAVASGRFDSRIQVGDKLHYLGRFDTPEEAHAAYVKKKRELHDFCTI